ncbi:MAG: type II toxin-antitoxin system VapC family toxin [Terracidiphilus sp.]|nr:type II toxin-antitoxin system VapC family toxin [Terracidiphilus sp.]MDR3799444.1 type II toxin-antitoxin system VapC family toxin [Terracidiphilus sp.]
MKEYVLDANAVLRYFVKGPGIEILDRIFAQAQRGEAALAMSVINRGEALYILAKRVGMLNAIETLRTLAHYVESVDVSEQFATEAATLKFNYRLGYADCFAAILAIRRGATLVTADPDFVKLGRILKVLGLPRHKS